MEQSKTYPVIQIYLMIDELYLAQRQTQATSTYEFLPKKLTNISEWWQDPMMVRKEKHNAAEQNPDSNFIWSMFSRIGSTISRSM